MKAIASFLGAIVFYTAIPLPGTRYFSFDRIARWAPVVGLFLGGVLGAINWGLAQFAVPPLTRSAGIVALWVVLTGGLHLDGAMDTADGLAVGDRQRRLEVMQDSATGAFGAMTAVILLLLKTAALSELQNNPWVALMTAAGWGRWGQVMAIAWYPYLKPTGKGAFHKQSMQLPQDVLLGLLGLLGFAAAFLAFNPTQGWFCGTSLVGGSAIALLSGYWFYRQLGGHTGDTYGAVVEWTETLLLCCFTTL